MAQETAPPRTTGSGPDEDPREQASAADPPPAGTPGRRVSLDQLLSVVVLSPAQAAVIAVRVLDAIRIILAGNGTHPAEDSRWAVSLGPSGEVDVGRAPAGAGTGITGLLERLTENARRLPAHPRPDQLVLLRRLEEAAADPHPEPGVRARQLEGALAEVLGPGAGPRVAGQLAALVGAFAHIAPSVSVPVTAPAEREGSAPAPRRTPPPRAPRGRRSRRRALVGRRRTRTRRTTLVLLFVVAALAGGAYVVLRDPGPQGAGATDRADRTPTAAPSDTSTAPVATPRPRRGVPTLAGRQNGQVTGVEVQKAGSCTPGALCPVTVTVHLRPASTTQPVVWRTGAARLCQKGITWSPPVSVTAQPGWTSVYASSSVAVPPGRSLALVALTTAPARAQSPPVPVSGSSPGC